MHKVVPLTLCALLAVFNIAMAQDRGLTCGGFLQADDQGRAAEYFAYADLIEKLDDIDQARGCKSALDSAYTLDQQHKNEEAFYRRICSTDPGEPFDTVARASYNMDRNIAKLGFGDGCH